MKALPFTLLVLLMVGCGNSGKWFYGEWKIDEVKTFDVAEGETQHDFLGAAIALMEGATLEITQDGIVASRGASAQTLPYELVDHGDGSVTLVTKAKDLRLARDARGVYMVYEKTVKVNDEVVQNNIGKIYLQKLQ